jgi:hypothetical protein
MNLSIITFLSAGAGSFIGAMIGAWLVTRWLFDRIRELEDAVETTQKALLQILCERPLQR